MALNREQRQLRMYEHELLHEPAPRYRSNEEGLSFSEKDVDPRTWRHMLKRLGDTRLDAGDVSTVGWPGRRLTRRQCIWLAQLSYELLQPSARRIYVVLCAFNFKQFIPVNNLNRAKIGTTQ